MKTALGNHLLASNNTDIISLSYLAFLEKRASPIILILLAFNVLVLSFFISYSCACRHGFKLLRDGSTCRGLQRTQMYTRL